VRYEIRDLASVQHYGNISGLLDKGWNYSAKPTKRSVETSLSTSGHAHVYMDYWQAFQSG